MSHSSFESLWQYKWSQPGRKLVVGISKSFKWEHNILRAKVLNQAFKVCLGFAAVYLWSPVSWQHLLDWKEESTKTHLLLVSFPKCTEITDLKKKSKCYLVWIYTHATEIYIHDGLGPRGNQKWRNRSERTVPVHRELQSGQSWTCALGSVLAALGSQARGWEKSQPNLKGTRDVRKRNK